MRLLSYEFWVMSLESGNSQSPRFDSQLKTHHLTNSRRCSGLKRATAMLCIQHATVITPTERIEDGAILIANGKVVAAAPRTAITLPDDVFLLNASGLIAVPGFIDLQLNG